MIKKGVVASIFLFLFMLSTLNFVSSAIVSGSDGTINDCTYGPEQGFNWANRTQIFNDTNGYDIIEPRIFAQANLTSIGMYFFVKNDSNINPSLYKTYSKNKNHKYEIKIEPIASCTFGCSADYINVTATKIDYTCEITNPYKTNYGDDFTDEVFYAELPLNETYLKDLGGVQGYGPFVSNYPNKVWYNISVSEIYVSNTPIVSTYDYALDFGYGSGIGNRLQNLNLSVKNIDPFLTSSENIAWTDITYGDIYTSRNYGANPIDGNSLNISVTNLGRYFEDGLPLKVEIYEKDTSSNDSIRVGLNALEGTVSGGQMNVTWTISESDLASAGTENYYEFFTKLVVSSYSSDHYNSDINVSNSSVITNLNNAWGDWMDEAMYENWTDSSISYSNTTSTVVAIKIHDITATTGTVVYFDIYEDDTFLGTDDEINVGGTSLNGTVAADGTAFVIWNITKTDLLNSENGPGDNENETTQGNNIEKVFEYYFKIRVGSESKTFGNTQLEVKEAQGQILQCSLITYCSDYTSSADCNADACTVGGGSQPSSLVDCSDGDIYCGCSWNATTSVCAPDHVTRYNGVDIGRCSYTEDLTQDDCSDGVLSYSWTAAWQWASSNTGLGTDPNDNNYIQDGALWYFDPDRASLDCQGGTNTRVCPAKVQLDFFSWFNVVLAVLILIVAYYFINKNKKPATKKTSKKKVAKKKASKKKK